MINERVTYKQEQPSYMKTRRKYYTVYVDGLFMRLASSKRAAHVIAKRVSRWIDQGLSFDQIVEKEASL